MATLSSITSFLDGDPATPTHLNSKLNSLVSNIAAVNTAVGSGGLPSAVTGDTLYAASTNSWVVAAGNTSTTTQWLSQVGSGTTAGPPSWRVPLLNQLTAPTGSVQFSQQQALQFRVENRTSDPSSPATGEIWFRTDL